MPQSDFLAAVAWRDLQPVLDEEVGRLPQKLRVPFVLCYLEGRTYDQAADQLGCLPGTISRRLAQARELLRSRLTRRGLALPTGVLAAALAEQSAAALSVPLATSTVRAALRGAAGTIPANVAALMDGGLRAMTLTKAKTLGAVLLTVGLACAGLGVLAHRALATRPDEAAGQQSKRPAAASEPKKDNDGGLRTIRGRVLDPNGNPVADARVLALTLEEDWVKKTWQYGGEGSLRLEAKDRARGDGDGRFRVRLPRPTDEEPRFPGVIVVRAPGFGLGLYAARKEAEKGEVTIRLPREQVLRGRLVDLQGAPAAGVTLYVAGVEEAHGNGDGVEVLPPNKPLPEWFAPLRTDAQGRFEVRGFGGNQLVALEVRADRFRPEQVKLWKTDADRRREVVHALEPARSLRGRVRYGDTGKPVAGAEVVALGQRVRTDKEGRFRLNTFRDPEHAYGSDLVTVLPPAGEPYVGRNRYPTKDRNAARGQELDFELPRGVLVHGKVVEEGTAKPVRGGAVCYLCPKAPVSDPSKGGLAIGLANRVPVAADGTFSVVVLPGPGTLLVNAASPDYVLREVSQNKLCGAGQDGAPLYLHGILPTDFKAGSGPQEVTVRLRHGVPVRGNLVGPDGQPVKRAQMLTRLTMNHYDLGFADKHSTQVDGPTFVLNACDPDEAYPVVFLDEKNRWGARVEVSGKQAGKPLTVRLERCGSAVLRFVNEDGESVEGHRPQVEIVLRPGRSRFDPKAIAQGKLGADAVHLMNTYSNSFPWDEYRTDARGRITLSALVPGVTHRVRDPRAPDAILREFTVRPGERLYVKDLVLKSK
jgi:hypothetical protein